MDMTGMQCHGCGSSNVTFDAKRRIMVCNQCGREEYYSRSTLNANGKVVFAKQNALNSFSEGKFENAYRYAMDVLNISMDNAPALYIMAYYDEFIMGRTGALNRFFDQINSVALEYDEVSELRQLMLVSAIKLIDHEAQVIELIAKNMQSPEDKGELCSFFDKLCPYFISKHTSCMFLTDQLSEMYQELVQHCGIPRTCFALLKSIDTNPDSPFSDHSFFLKSKSAYFYQNYILKLAKVFEGIPDNDIRAKFMKAYKNKCLQFKQEAGI